MFCLECGSEILRGASACSACGQRLSNTDETAAITFSPTLSSPAAPMAQASPARSVANPSQFVEGRIRREESAAPQSPLMPAARSTLPLSDTLPQLQADTADAPSIRWGDLDAPGFPQDILSRVVVVVALGLAANVLTPWVLINGHAISPARLGLPAIAFALLMVAVALPTLSPPLRRGALLFGLPFGVGAMCFGAGALAWLALDPLGPRLSADLIAEANSTNPLIGTTAKVVPETATLTLSFRPGIGLYLLLLGSCALMVLGYQLYVQSARASGRAASWRRQATAAAAPSAVALATSTRERMYAGGAESNPEPTLAAMAPTHAQRAGESATSSVGTPLALLSEADSGPVPLPGTARWHQASEAPVIIRQTGWRGGQAPRR